MASSSRSDGESNFRGELGGRPSAGKRSPPDYNNEDNDNDPFLSMKAEEASGVTTGMILALRESLQNSKDTLVTCQNELEAAKSEIQSWLSTLKNEPSLPAGITPDPKVLINYLDTLKSSEVSLRQQLEKAEKKEAAFIVTFAKREKEMAELKSVMRDLKDQLKPSAMQARRLLLDPVVHEEFTRLKNLVEEKDKQVKQLQDDIKAVSFTTQRKMGKMLMAKCRNLQEENEEIGNRVSEGKIHELTLKLALQKSQNSQLKSHFEGLQKHMEGLTNDVERSNEMVLMLQDKIEEKDREIQRLKDELQQKKLEDGRVDAAHDRNENNETIAGIPQTNLTS